MRHRMQREKRNELIQRLSQESSKPKPDTAFKSVILEAVQTITNDLTEFVAGDIADQIKQLFVVASTLLPRD